MVSKKEVIYFRINREVKKVFQKNIVPIIENYVNNSADFAPLRQLYYALILANCFKTDVEAHNIYRGYINQEEARAISHDHPDEVKRIIYDSYIRSFQQGAYNRHVTEYDRYFKRKVTKSYFAGGNVLKNAQKATTVHVENNAVIFDAKFKKCFQEKVDVEVSFNRKQTTVEKDVSCVDAWDESKSRQTALMIAQELGVGEQTIYHQENLLWGETSYALEYCGVWTGIYKGKIDVGGGWHANDLFFVRIGYLFFIDEQIYQRLSPQLKEILKNNCIRANIMETVFANEALREFTITTIIAMLNSDFQNKFVIDAGAGDGILSLVASKLGAEVVTLIEYNYEKLAYAEKLLTLNGLRRNKDFRLLAMDLRYTENIVTKLAIRDFKGEIAIISNIGTWPNTYVVTNQTSMKLIQYLPKVSLFIAGGYRGAKKEKYSNVFTKLEHVFEDQKCIHGMGFSVLPHIAKFDNNHIYLGSSLPVPIAWAAVRKLEQNNRTVAAINWAKEEVTSHESLLQNIFHKYEEMEEAATPRHKDSSAKISEDRIKLFVREICSSLHWSNFLDDPDDIAYYFTEMQASLSSGTTKVSTVIECAWQTLENAMRRIYGNCDPGNIEKMTVVQFAQALGAIEITADVNFLHYPAFFVPQESAELIRMVREEMGDGDYTKGKQMVWDAINEQAAFLAPQFKKMLPLCVFYFNPQVEQTGIYYSLEKFEECKGAITKSVIFHEFLEKMFCDNSAVDPLFQKAFSHAHWMVIVEELKFAACVNELPSRLAVYKKYLEIKKSQYQKYDIPEEIKSVFKKYFNILEPLLNELETFLTINAGPPSDSARRIYEKEQGKLKGGIDFSSGLPIINIARHFKQPKIDVTYTILSISHKK